MAAPALAAAASAASSAVDRSEIGLYRYMQECDNPRMSMTFSHTKGLLNAPGQNNCFLNSAVQVFWHLDVFRRNFRRLSGHMCMGRSCIFCALKVIFTQFQHSDKGAQPPDPLRRALAHTFADQQRFQLGFMDDAAECFENILLRIHTHIAPNEPEDQCRAKHCIPHRKFSLAITEQVSCDCGGVTEPFSYNEMVFYVSTSALVAEGMAAYQANPNAWGNFAHLLKDTVAKGDIRSCPRNCGKRCEKKRILTNHPDVVSIGLVWDSAKSGAEHIQDVVGCVGTTLRLQELFHNSATPDAIKHNTVLNLVGVVCYYGKHYSTFFFHSKVEEWIYFDDASVKQVSPNWEDVVDRIVRGRHQPLLLLYMNPHTQLLSVDTAPQCTEMVQGYEWHDDATSAAIGLNGKEDSVKSSGSLSSLPPPPPGFDGGSSDSSSTTSSVTPVFSSSTSKQQQQWPSVQHKSTCHDAANAACHPATYYSGKNAAAAAAFPRQFDDRDSGADEGSYTDLDRQSSHISTDDTASSYSSRASGSSGSCAGDRELYAHHHRNYARALSVPANNPWQSNEVGGCDRAGSHGGDRRAPPLPPQDGSSDKCNERVRMRKKKSRGSQSGQAPAVGGGMTPSSRCLSAVSLASAGSEPAAAGSSGNRGDSSNRQSGHSNFLNGSSSCGDPPGYATLPRKKKIKPPVAPSVVATAAAADELSRHVDWIKEVAKKSEQLQPSNGNSGSAAASSSTTASMSRLASVAKADECADVRDRIRQFNGLGTTTTDGAAAAAALVGSWSRHPVAAAAAANGTATAASTSGCPASQRCSSSSSSTVLKPMPLYGGAAADAWPPTSAALSAIADESGYINRNSVERFIRQQRSSTTVASPTKEQRSSVVTPAAARPASSALVGEFAGLRVTVSASADTASVGSLKDSGYRSGGGAGGCGGSSGGDRTSLSSVGSSSLFSESPSHRSGGGNSSVFDFTANALAPSKQPPTSIAVAAGAAGSAAAAAAAAAAHWAPSAAAIPEGLHRSAAAAVGIMAAGGRSCAHPAAAPIGGGDEHEEDEFPPPPSEQELQCIGLVGGGGVAAGWHVKQASLGSLSSETSTLRNSCGAGGSRTDCTDEEDDDEYRRSCAVPSASSGTVQQQQQQNNGLSGDPRLRHQQQLQQQFASVDACDSGPSPAVISHRQAPWSSSTAVRFESSPSPGSGSGGIAPPPAVHPQLARALSSAGPAPPAVEACERKPGVDVHRSTTTARPVVQATLPFGHKASIGGVAATGGSVQPVSGGQHGQAQQNPPLRFASAHDSEGKVPSQSAAAVAPNHSASALRKADEPISDATRRLSSSSASSSASSVALTTSTAASSPASAGAQPSADSRSSQATASALPPWQQQPPPPPQRSSSGLTEPRDWSRPSVQPAVPSHSSGGRCGPADSHLAGPAALPSSVHGSLERSHSTPTATTHPSATVNAMSSSFYAPRTAAVQQRQNSTEGVRTAAAAVAPPLLQSPVPAGPTARMPAAVSAVAVAAAPPPPLPAPASGTTNSVEGAHHHAAGEVARGGQAPPRLYGAVQPPANSTTTTLVGACARQRDSYAQSLGSAAVDLFSRGMMLPPKVRRDVAPAPSAAMGPTTAAAAAAAAGLPSSRTPYELGYSHYDRLPRSQQQPTTAMLLRPGGTTAAVSGGSAPGGAAPPAPATARAFDQRDAVVPALQAQAVGASYDRSNGVASPWSDQQSQQQLHRDGSSEPYQQARPLMTHAQSSIEHRADGKSYVPQQLQLPLQQQKRDVQHYAPGQSAASLLTYNAHAQPVLVGQAQRHSACTSTAAAAGSYGHGATAAGGGPASAQQSTTEWPSTSHMPPWHRPQQQQPPPPQASMQPLVGADHRQQPMRFTAGATGGKVTAAAALQWDGL